MFMEYFYEENRISITGSCTTVLYTVVYIRGWHYENISIGIPRRLALDPQDDWAFEM